MDLHTQIITAYTSQNYLDCINLIDSAPPTINSTSHLKTLKASCLINIEGKCAEAFEILNKIIKEEPLNGLAFYSKGLAHLKEEKLELSIECFNKAANLDTKGAISKAQVIKLKEDVMRMKAECNKSTKIDNESKTFDLPEKKIPKKRSLTCKICQRTFAQSFSLSRHILIHTGERPHRCELCNAGFIQKSDLNRHMSIHNDAANFGCEECGKKFKTKKNLSCHQLTHSEVRPFECRECDKTFRYKRLLKYHEGMHLKVKPYNCDFCGKEFSAKPNLKSHLKTHVKRINKIKSLEPQKVFTSPKLEPVESLSDFISISASSRDSEGSDEVGDSEWKFFFKSLVNDLNKMDDKQKRKFKTKTFALIDEILQ